MKIIPHSLNNIKYSFPDSAPIACNDCEGCDACCHNMGDSIVQDPYDLWNFCSHMKVEGGNAVTFELLISEDGPWELSRHDNLILPNIKMVDDGKCPFLSETGRCTIHKIRSGLCRLYPLGRYYEVPDGSSSETLSYYILDNELGCSKSLTEGTPVAISEWLGIEDGEKYEKFLLGWHSVKNDMNSLVKSAGENVLAQLMELVLRIFYERPYTDNFFSEFDNRLSSWKRIIAELYSGSDLN